MRIRSAPAAGLVLAVLVLSAAAPAWPSRPTPAKHRTGEAALSRSRAAAGARAAERRPSARRLAAARTAAAPTAGMVVGRDPETGALGMPERRAGSFPTVAELQAAARLESEGLVTVRNADGSETLNHEGRFTTYTVVRVGPRGKPFFHCAHGAEGARCALHPAAPVRSPHEEE